MDLDNFNTGDNDDDDESSLDDLLDRLSDDDTADAADEESSGTRKDTGEGFEWVSQELNQTDEDPLEQAYDANHVLALSPLRRRASDELCHDLCTPAPPSQLDVLFISLTRTSEDIIEHWQTHEPTLPANMAILCADDQSGATDSSQVVAGAIPSRITIKTTPDPSDLTRLGLAVVNILSEWNDTGNQPVVCVHSLTAFLQYVDPQRLFRFFHLLQARIDRLDGYAHYHMDPTAHSQETIGIFHTLFDTIVRVDDTGTITIDQD